MSITFQRYNGSEWVTESEGGGGGISNHASLTNLAWTNSKHTGSASHLAGFDSLGASSEYDEANYFLKDGSRAMTGNLLMPNPALIGSGSDLDLIELDGTLSEVTVNGEFEADTGRFDGGLGVDCAPSSLSGVCIQGTHGLSYRGMSSDITAIPTQAGEAFFASRYALTIDSGAYDVTSAIGATGFVTATSSYLDDITEMVGINAFTYQYSRGTATRASVFRGELQCVGFGSITDGIGLDLFNFSVSGRDAFVTNMYGIKIADVSAGDNSWSIYSAGGNMVHAGGARFGDTTTPTEKLEVNGNILATAGNVYKVGAAVGQTGTFTFGGGSSGDIATMTFTGGILTGTTTVP